MQRVRYLLIVIVFAVCCSCGNEAVNNTNITNVQNSQSVKIDSAINKDTVGNSFSISHFKSFPKDIQGCSCSFSGDTLQYQSEEYLFVADYDSSAYVSINKQLIKLKMVSTTRQPGSFGSNDRTEVYSNGSYKVTVDFKYKSGTGEETWWNEGTMTVEDKYGIKKEEKIVGECGC